MAAGRKRERAHARELPLFNPASKWPTSPKNMPLRVLQGRSRLARTNALRQFKSRERAPTSLAFYRWVRCAKPPAAHLRLLWSRGYLVFNGCKL